MDRAAGFIRRRDILDAAIAEAREDLRAIRADGLGGLDPYDRAEALRNRSLALAHLAYLEACRVQSDRSGSRGGSIAVAPSGEPLSPLLGPEWSILPERTEARAETTVCIPDGDDSFLFRFEPCRPVPETPGWFENVWRDYRERSIYGASRRVPAPLKWAIVLLTMILCQGCLSQRNGEPFVHTRVLTASGGMHHPLYTFIDLCALPVCVALDVAGFPIDVAIQLFGPARVRVVDEEGNPVPEAEAIFKIDCGAPGDTVLYRETARNGSFRIRRRVSEKNGGHPNAILVAKEGFCPIREVDFTAFTTSNVMTVTMPRFTPGYGYVGERSPNDPASCFPPWPTTNQGWWSKKIGIECVRGTASPWNDVWNYGERPWDFMLIVGMDNQKFSIPLHPGRSSGDDGCVAVASIDQEHPNAVPRWVTFQKWESLPADALAVDNPLQAVFFRLSTASKENQYQYGRIDFYWENGLPVGIRRIHFFDPKEQDIVPAPDPSRYFEKAEEKVSRRSKNTGNHR